MKIIESLLSDLEFELENTRKTLERVPEGKFDWKPHAKSFSMGALASHVATLPLWGVTIVERDSFDVGATSPADWPAPAKTRQELLEQFDSSASKLRAALALADDARLLMPWSLFWGDKTIFTMPRMNVLRTSLMNHIIHHRAQLGVYLRLNDVPVPGLYGPSADEQGN